MERDTGGLDDLEADTWDVSLGLAGATETRDEHLVVLVNEVEATVVGDEARDLLAVLDELHTHGLAHGRVGLLGLDTAEKIRTSANNEGKTQHQEIKLN